MALPPIDADWAAARPDTPAYSGPHPPQPPSTSCPVRSPELLWLHWAPVMDHSSFTRQPISQADYVARSRIHTPHRPPSSSSSDELCIAATNTKPPPKQRPDRPRPPQIWLHYEHMPAVKFRAPQPQLSLRPASVITPQGDTRHAPACLARSKYPPQAAPPAAPPTLKFICSQTAQLQQFATDIPN